MKATETTTCKLLSGVVVLAFEDAVKGISLYDNEVNSAKKLEERLKPLVFDQRLSTREGDKSAFRAIYTKARWLLDMHDEHIVQNPNAVPPWPEISP